MPPNLSPRLKERSLDRVDRNEDIALEARCKLKRSAHARSRFRRNSKLESLRRKARHLCPDRAIQLELAREAHIVSALLHPGTPHSRQSTGFGRLDLPFDPVRGELASDFETAA